MKYLAQIHTDHGKHEKLLNTLKECKNWAGEIIIEFGPTRSLDVYFNNKTRTLRTFYTINDTRWRKQLKELGAIKYEL